MSRAQLSMSMAAWRWFSPFMSIDKYDLIIFDCDGTLVNSEELNNTCCSNVLIDFGLKEYTPQKCLDDFTGKSWNDILAFLRKNHDETIPSSIIDDYVTHVKDALKTADLSIDGAKKFVGFCNNHFKICVGSNGERSNVLQELELQHFMDYFDEQTIFTKIQVKNAKPAPDLFLYAAEKMSVEPARCLVIEDSPTGVKAGVAAGMDVWGFTGVAHDKKHAESRLKQAGATHIFDDFIHMQDMLKL